jgi:glycosyltransferase involved in cell wall biosynthesis
MPPASTPFRIVHVFRAPVGGLFRHVMDIARLQAERGCEVGIIADSSTGGERAEKQLAELTPILKLGILRVPMHRNPHPSDLGALRVISRHLEKVSPHVLHGHGAKGGLYARLPSVFRKKPWISAYTPHGGSLNYFPGTVMHRLYMHIERLLERGTGLFLFESQFVADRYRGFVGQTNKPVQVFLNGLHAHEFETVTHSADATDLMFIGELRHAKGIDLLLDAIGAIRQKTGRQLSLSVIGSGPDEAALKARAERHGIAPTTKFLGAMNARAAFQRGRIMVVPSRFESMPYVVLEAAGSAQPMISTRVGGIAEIFGDDAHALIAPDSAKTIEEALLLATGDGATALADRTARLRARVMSDFSASIMADTVLAGYRTALAANGVTHHEGLQTVMSQNAV